MSVRGIGKSRQARIYRGVMYDTSSIERILISIVVRDKNAEKTVQAIIKSAQTGEIGDGRIFRHPPLRMPYAYVLQREATSHSTMPNKKDNGQLQTTTKKIQYN